MKKFLILSAVLVVCISIVGCSKKKQEKPATPKKTTQEITEVNPVKEKITGITWSGQAALTVTRDEGNPVEATALFEVTFFDQTAKVVFQWCETNPEGERICYDENVTEFPSYVLQKNIITITDEDGDSQVYEYRDDDFGVFVWRNLDDIKKSATDQGWTIVVPDEAALAKNE